MSMVHNSALSSPADESAAGIFDYLTARLASVETGMQARHSWDRVWIDACALACEAASVIALRTVKIAAADSGAATETHRMISEKIEAGLVLQVKALCGGLGMTPLSMTAKMLTHYRQEVSANNQRLQTKSASLGQSTNEGDRTYIPAVRGSRREGFLILHR